jgi:hypothetical protein
VPDRVPDRGDGVRVADGAGDLRVDRLLEVRQRELERAFGLVALGIGAARSVGDEQ